MVLPSLMSLGGRINKEAEGELMFADFYGDPDVWNYWCTKGRSMIILAFLGKITLEDLEESEIPEQPAFVKSDAEPEPDFWTWKLGGQPRDTLPTWKWELYRMAEDYLSRGLFADTAYGLTKRQEEAYSQASPPWKEGDPEDILIKKFCSIQGVWVGGSYLYRPPDAEFDIFSGGGDSDSEAGDPFGGLWA